MKILHTSDWHLGQSFHDYDRTLEHQSFLDWLVLTLETRQIDALVVSGDIYDVSNPSSSSQKMLAQFIVNAKTRCPQLQMVITGGNHDSGSRLETPGELARAFDTQIIGNLPLKTSDDNKIVIDWDSAVIPLRDGSGTVRAWCGAVPFVRQEEWTLYRSVAQENFGDQGYQSCLKSLYADMADHMDSVATDGQRKIAMGHLHLSSGEISVDSERKLVIGGEEAVDSSLFGDRFDYVALGHLHKAQRIGSDFVRYSGSPLPLSYTEMNYRHQVVILDLDNMDIELLPVPRKVPLLAIPQNHGEKSVALAALKQWQPDVAGLPKEEWPYLTVRVSMNRPDPDLAAEIHSVLADKELRFCRIDNKIHLDEADPQNFAIDASVGLEQLTPARVFVDLYQRKNAAPVPPELNQAFETIVNITIQNQEVQA